MATTQSLLDRVRLELNDQPSSFVYTWPNDGSLSFQVDYRPLNASSLIVAAGTTALVTPGDYTVDERSGTIKLTAAQTVPVTVAGVAYSLFTDADLTTFINTAVSQHLHNRTDDLGYPMTISTLPPIEDYLVAVLAVVQALWALATDASFDIDIHTPEGVSIPRSERYQQLMAMIGQRQAQYQSMAAQLNVGLARIEISNLRRVSRTTNRLIPEYVEQEINDNRPPRQVFPPIDQLGATLPNITEPPRIDLVAYANQTFTRQLTGLGNLTGLSIRAHARPYPANYSSLATFAVVVNDAVNGVVTITLSSDQTWFLPTSCFWDIESVDTASPPNVTTLTQGTLNIVRQGQP